MEIDANTLNSFFTMLSALILAIIAWYNKQRTDSAAVTAAATTQTAETNTTMAAPALVIVTGPWDGGSDPTTKADNISSKAGTRVIVDEESGSFQLIDDRIAQNFIVGGAGKNSGPSGEFKFSGNLALVTRGKLL